MNGITQWTCYKTIWEIIQEWILMSIKYRGHTYWKTKNRKEWDHKIISLNNSST